MVNETRVLCSHPIAWDAAWPTVKRKDRNLEKVSRATVSDTPSLQPWHFKRLTVRWMYPNAKEQVTHDGVNIMAQLRIWHDKRWYVVGRGRTDFLAWTDALENIRNGMFDDPFWTGKEKK